MVFKDTLKNKNFMLNVIQFYKKTERFIVKTVLGILLLSSINIMAQKKNIVQGKIIDNENNEPVIGATIAIKDSSKANKAIATDVNGGFSIEYSSLPVTINVSYIGYKDQEIEIYDNSEPITVFLEEISNKLKEVVVVGYGTQKRAELTGAISSISPSFLEQPTSSFDNLLNGSISGLAITETSGQPGASSTIKIRGGNSITGGNDPLYVIDGFIWYNDNTSTRTGAGKIDGGLNPLSFINPQDIESIEVLKDVSASAIYGSRGANGVIIITTKKGKKGSNTVNYQATYSIQNIIKKIDLMGAKDWANLYNELQTDGGLPATFTSAQINSFGKGTDWEDAALQGGSTETHQLSFNGGDDKTRYLISGNYTNQKGIIINTNMVRYSARVNIDRDIFKNFKVGVDATGSSITQNGLTSYSGNQTAGRLAGPFDFALRNSPLAQIYNSDGTFNYTNPYSEGDLHLGNITANPISDLVNSQVITKTSTLMGNFYASYTIIPSLVLKINSGIYSNHTIQDFYAPSTSVVGLIPIGLGSIGNKLTTSWQNDYTINYSKRFKNHYISVLAGYTTQNTNVEWSTATQSDFSNESLGFNNLGGGSQPGSATSGAIPSILNSYIGRVNYSLLERYNLTATIRGDQSSRFSPNNQWGYFPSLGLSWNINKEPFFSGIANTISDLKLRLSTGTVGNQEIGDFQYLGLYTAGFYSFGGQLVTAYNQSTLANPNLKWESTNEQNVGIDAGFIDNRINLVVDAYLKNTSNLLVQVPVEYTTGFTSELENVGSVQNKGIEVSINAAILKGPDFSWSVTVNYAKNINKVTSLGGMDYFLPDFNSADNPNLTPLNGVNPLIVKVGQPLGTFYGYTFNGVVQKNDDLSKVPVPSWTTVPVQPGDPKFVDYNGDGVIDENDKVCLGNAQPKFIYGFGTSFTYKHLDFSVLFQGSYGNKLYNALEQNLETTSQYYNCSEVEVNRWTPTNPSNTIPRAVAQPYIILDSRYIEDASFLKLKNLIIGYTFPLKSLLTSGSKLRIFVSGQNLLTFTKYRGFDPEASRYGDNETNGLYQGIDLGAYPSSRSFMGGVSLTF